MPADFSIENSLRPKYGRIAGTDEAGRGPIAGPVAAAAVILPEDFDLTRGIDDSKKISEKKRKELALYIKENAIAYKVVFAGVERIERENILQTAVWSMKQAVAELLPRPYFLLVDGNYYPNSPIPRQTVVKGDSKSISIAAASILAKTERDAFMVELAESYPEYGFEKHKGYGTKAHYQAIDKYGISPVHRKSFLKKYFAAKAQEKLF